MLDLGWISEITLGKGGEVCYLGKELNHYQSTW
jgi:hypothetical protein